MHKSTDPRPPALPPQVRGEGSWKWLEDRQVYELRFYLEKGRQIPVTGKTAQECRDKKARKIALHERRKELEGETTLEAVSSGWLSTIDRAKSTNDGYLASHRQLVNLLCGDTELEDLTKADLDEVWRHLIKDLGRGRQTLAKRRTHWNAMLRWAVANKKITAAKAEELAYVKTDEALQASHRPPRHAWHSDVNYGKVRAYLGRPEATARDILFLTMLLTGLRPSEAEGLKVEYLDVPGGHLDVEGCIKDTPEGRVWSPELKTDRLHPKGHRRLWLPSDLKRALGRLELRRPAGAEFVFIEEEGPRKGRRVNHTTITKHAKEIALETGTKWIHPNGCRHTFASVCLTKGMRPEELAVLMGHATTAEIIGTYGHALRKVNGADMERYLDLGGKDEDEGEAGAVVAA
jgi:integrase